MYFIVLCHSFFKIFVQIICLSGLSLTACLCKSGRSRKTSHCFQLNLAKLHSIWHILAGTFNYIRKKTNRNVVSQIVRTRQAIKVSNICKATVIVVQISSYLFIVHVWAYIIKINYLLLIQHIRPKLPQRFALR